MLWHLPSYVAYTANKKNHCKTALSEGETLGGKVAGWECKTQNASVGIDKSFLYRSGGGLAVSLDLGEV